MKIEFYNKTTGTVIDNTDLFVMDNKVWCDTYETCESQSATVGFEDFIRELDYIDWRVVK